MRLFQSLILSLLISVSASATDWQVLFDGSSMDGWKIAENEDSVKLEDGLMVLGGERAHVFWMGEDGKASFENFEAEVVFQTAESANAGLFFHTKWQEKGWPAWGLECQMNATHKDPRKTGSIYAIQDVDTPGHKDGEWVSMKLKVEGRNVKVWVNGELHNEWTQPEDHSWEKKRIKSGTFAFQAHDPGSVVKVKSFKVKPLP